MSAFVNYPFEGCQLLSPYPNFVFIYVIDARVATGFLHLAFASPWIGLT